MSATFPLFPARIPIPPLQRSPENRVILMKKKALSSGIHLLRGSVTAYGNKTKIADKSKEIDYKQKKQWEYHQATERHCGICRRCNSRARTRSRESTGFDRLRAKSWAKGKEGYDASNFRRKASWLARGARDAKGNRREEVEARRQAK